MSTSRVAHFAGAETRERLAWLAGGAALTFLGMRRRSPLGTALAVIGGGLAACGALRVQTRHTANPDKPLGPGRGARVEETIVIERPPAQLYAAWRNLEFLGGVMSHLRSVTCLDDRRSHWTVEGPAGTTVEWDAEIVRDVPDQLIGWRSLPGSDVDSAGSVRFRPRRGGRATEVQVVLRYDPPGGALGTVLASALGEDPAAQIREDLLRLRRRVRAGFAPLPAARRRTSCRKPRKNRSRRAIRPRGRRSAGSTSAASSPATSRVQSRADRRVVEVSQEMRPV